VLVDAGPAASDRTRDARILPHLRERGVRRLEALVLTHPHLDHIGGARAVMAELAVALVLDPGLPSGSASFVEVLEAAEREGGGWRGARLGDRLELDGLTLEVLHEVDDSLGVPDDANESSVVVLARFGDFEALLTGDAPSHVEEDAVARSGPVEVLKVGHHGSRTSTSGLLLERARAQAAVISLGRGNRYGHPHGEVLERLEGSGTTVYRTDLDGTVRVTGRPDGTFTVRVARPGRERVAAGARPGGN
jgi:competence protein ComEC